MAQIGTYTSLPTIDRDADLIGIVDVSASSEFKKTTVQDLMDDAPATAGQPGSMSIVHFAKVDALTGFLAVRALFNVNVTQSGTTTGDGVSLSLDDVVLCIGQTTASQNGVKIVKSGAWVDHPAYTAAPRAGFMVYVNEGTVFRGTLFALGTTGTITVGSTSTYWHHVGGRAARQVVSTSSATILPGIDIVEVTYSSGVCSLTLPNENYAPIDYSVLIEKNNTSSNGISVVPDSGSAINGGTTDAAMTMPLSSTASSSSTANIAGLYTRKSSTAWGMN